MNRIRFGAGFNPGCLTWEEASFAAKKLREEKKSLNADIPGNIKPFALERYMAAHEFSARHLLCCSDCESYSVSEILAMEEGSEERFLSMPLGYTESLGSPMLRKEIAGLYKSINDDDILVHAGAQEAVHNFMHSFLKPGDEVIVQYPCYQSLYEVAASLGCKVSFWNMRHEGGWFVDIDELRKLMKPSIRAVIVNSPHNPTGYVFSMEEKLAIAGITEASGAIIFSDEVYRFTEYEKPQDSFCDLTDRAVSLGVMSKSLGLPGLRIGWIATRNREVMTLMKEYKDYTTICSSAPSEFLAVIALRNRKTILKRNNDFIKKNLNLLRDALIEREDIFSWLPPEGGPVAFVGIKGRDAGEFCSGLLEDTGVLLMPGIVFGEEFSQFIRFGMGRKSIKVALNLLKKYCNKKV
jgi:aspartate/methionine/tyrosine aminotransferase